ncbi:MAG TPA: DUF3300 domain-containing protein [Caldimonas sp.]|nr:DUF3300 domain-containing protein [Caldimonas sp.]HEX4235884.1 DUF3300 domain-containing protein [Caldimonas sp.]
MSRSPFRVALTAALLAVAVSAAAQPVPANTGTPSAAAGSQQELDSVLAPIALFPDSLVAQILMASTYPLEVVLAARWSAAHPEVNGTALEDAMQKEEWDPSVKALTAVPQMLKHMSDNLAWTQKLGDAFLADGNAVRDTIQALRAKAVAAGNLKSTPEQTVRTEVVENKTVYIIESAQPNVLYVPTYDPYYAYGDWWWSYPPYYMYPPGYYYPPGLAFAAGIIIGAAIWGNCNWGGGNFVTVNPLNYNKFNRTNTGDRNWSHRVDHRKGVAYGDNRVAQRYDRGSDSQAVRSREQFRARADQGRTELRTMDASQLQGSAEGNRAGSIRSGSGEAGRGAAGAATREASRGSGFSGADLGSSSREASSRGSASRSSMGGARVGGGARGGGGGRR